MRVKVHILTDVSDLSGVHKAGDEPEVEEARAAEYLASGIAREVTGDVAPQGELETASLGGAHETATHPRGKPRG